MSCRPLRCCTKHSSRAWCKWSALQRRSAGRPGQRQQPCRRKCSQLHRHRADDQQKPDLLQRPCTQCVVRPNSVPPQEPLARARRIHDKSVASQRGSWEDCCRRWPSERDVQPIIIASTESKGGAGETGAPNCTCIAQIQRGDMEVAAGKKRRWSKHLRGRA